MELRKEIVEIKRTRLNLVIFMIAAVVSINVAVATTSQSGTSKLSMDLSRVLSVGSAVVISSVVILRQGIDGIFGRAYLALTAGLVLTLGAESMWAYYELVLHIENPFPSIADALWISSYGPIGFHLFSMARFYGRGVGKYKMMAVVGGMSIFSALYILLIVDVSTLKGTDAVLETAISLAYPLLDTALFMPAILIVINSGRGYLTSIPWIFIAWISLGIADTLLGVVQVQNFAGNLLLVNMFYVISYLGMAVGLWWYNKFFIFDKAKVRFTNNNNNSRPSR